MRIAIDTGGTFTDCVYTNDTGLHILKIPSTPSEPGAALLSAVERIATETATEIRHGTTVATNALLERKGARVAFVTTEGFEDTIAIGRQARPKLYDLFLSKEPPLAMEGMRFGVAERTASDGQVLVRPSEAELARLKNAVGAAKPEAVAISLLFSFANSNNERRVAAALQELGVQVSISHEILPEFREYERGSTVVINAYLAPLMERYLQRLHRTLEGQGRRLHVMQSSGGIISAAVAAREPVRTILSGPAGGVIGARAMAEAAGFSRILTFDMGGTSTDVALIGGKGDLPLTKESLISGLPVAIPMLNIHTVGAGGGSVARFDRGGALRVGPESAGADPGPICYGRGTLPTVTDANLLLGRIDADSFGSGGMRLDRERTIQYLSQLKGSLDTAEQFAAGIIRVIDAHMEKALRRISVEQGYDPREFTLLSFGGAGPLHAVALARALRIPKIIVPNFPGALSAFGILIADVVRDYSRTIMLTPGDPQIEHHFGELENLARGEMQSEAVSGMVIRSLDVRYSGQGYELTVPWSLDFVEQFHALHEQRYGYADRIRPIEVVDIRVRMVAKTEEKRTPGRLTPGPLGEPVLKTQKLYYEGGWLETKILDRKQLMPGAIVQGPVVIAEYSATTFLPPQSLARVDTNCNLIVEVHA